MANVHNLKWGTRGIVCQGFDISQSRPWDGVLGFEPEKHFGTFFEDWVLKVYCNSDLSHLSQVLSNVDELFDREELAAAPDSGWPDCFNSGVFVFQPSLKTFQQLLQFANEHGSFDGKFIRPGS